MNYNCTLQINTVWKNQKKLNYEIIVYNDGSKDNTIQILKKLTSQLKSLRYINGDYNKGYGYGMKKAIENAHGDYIVTIDSDNQYKIENIKHFMFLFDSDISCATGHREKKKDSLLKVFADQVLKLIIKILFKTKFLNLSPSDIQLTLDKLFGTGTNT